MHSLPVFHSFAYSHSMLRNIVVQTWQRFAVLVHFVQLASTAAFSQSSFFNPSSFPILVDLSSLEHDEIQINNICSTLSVDAWICRPSQIPNITSRSACFVRLSDREPSLMTASVKEIDGAIMSCELYQNASGMFDADPTSHTYLVEDDTAVCQTLHDHVVCLVGDVATAFSILQKRRDNNTHGIFVWKPTVSSLEELETLAISVYRMRSLGCLGLILRVSSDWSHPDDLDVINRAIRKFQRPCSAMDYPPYNLHDR